MSGVGSKSSGMPSNEQVEADLLALAALRDADIDTSNVSETVNFADARRAAYLPVNQRGYDIRAIANWCIQKARQEQRKIGALWLTKIVYFIYERALQDWRVLLSPARVEAWKHGPVFRELYFDEDLEKEASFYKSFNKSTRKMEIATEDFSTQDIDIFTEVWEKFGRKSGSELRRISHAPGSPWHEVWSNSKHEGGFNLQIDVATILGLAPYTNGRKRSED